jgi:hypothetical protein
MLAPGDHGPGSSSVLLRNPDASKQRYTDPHVVEPVHGGAGDLIAIERSDQLFFVDDNPNGEESLALLFRCVRRNELLCVADLVAQTRPAS